MNGDAKLWLPSASPADAEAAIAAIVDEWAADWFAAPPGLEVNQVAADDVTGDLRETPGLNLTATGSDLARLGAAICQAGDPGNSLDTAILVEVAKEAGDHLLAKVAGPDAPVTSAHAEEAALADGLLHFSITAGNAEWTQILSLSAARLTALRRRLAPGEHVPQLGRIADALVMLPCRISAHLGEAGLSAGEVAALGPGDVILLDRLTSAPVPLLVEGRFAEHGSARIEGCGDHVQIAITEPVSLQARKLMTA